MQKDRVFQGDVIPADMLSVPAYAAD